MHPSLSSIRLSNAEFMSKLARVPVAVFFGGTSGIGQGMAENFARWRGGKAHIIIVGRNEGAAQEIISRFPKPDEPAAEWSHEFIKCDATLMSNVHTASQTILGKHTKINFLVMTAGYFSGEGRQETKEGIDAKLAVHYYSRWKFINDLLPGLRKAKDEGEEARVVSVFSTGAGGPIDPDDLGLKKNYSMRNAAGSATTYNDYMIESFAERNPGITFTHSYPGGVRTNLVSNARTGWIRALSPVFTLLYPLTVSIHDCGEYMWHGLLHTQGGGSYRFGRKGQVLEGVQYSGNHDIAEKLWEHTEKATSVGSA